MLFICTTVIENVNREMAALRYTSIVLQLLNEGLKVYEGTIVKDVCADLRIWQRVKDGCRCGGHPTLTDLNFFFSVRLCLQQTVCNKMH